MHKGTQFGKYRISRMGFVTQLIYSEISPNARGGRQASGCTFLVKNWRLPSSPKLGGFVAILDIGCKPELSDVLTFGKNVISHEQP